MITDLVVFFALMAAGLALGWFSGELVRSSLHDELGRQRTRNAQLEVWIDEGRYAAAKVSVPAPPAASVSVGPAPELPAEYVRELDRIEDDEVRDEYKQSAIMALRANPNLRGADLLAHVGLEALP